MVDRPPARAVTGGDPALAADQRNRIRSLEATVEALRDELAGAERDTVGLRVELARAEERVKSVEAVARGDVEAAKRVVEAELAAKDEVVRELRAQVAREIERGDALAKELAGSPAALVAAVVGLNPTAVGDDRCRRQTAIA